MDAYIQIISGTRAGQKFRVDSSIHMGRSPDCQLSFSGLEANLVSGKHAVFEIKGSGLYIRDLNSTNGTFVNGERASEHRLQENNIVTLGLNGPKIRVLSTGEVSPDTFISSIDSPQENFEPLEKTVQDREKRPPSQSLFPGAEGSYTIGLAHRFKEDEVDHNEIQDLIKDGKRVERMVQSGVLSDKDARMIHSASQTYSRSKKKHVWILSFVSTLAFIIVSFLAWQNMGYRGRLKEQSKLMDNIHTLEQKIESSQGPSMTDAPPDEEKLLAVAKLRAAERKLMELRSHLESKDLINTYKNPLGREIHQIMEGFGKQNYIIPDLFISQVEKHIRALANPSPNTVLSRSFRNKRYHFNMIVKELTLAGMPTEFAYLSMHESLLDSTIVSKAGARGLWQFMPATGRDYLLKVPNNWTELPTEFDERTNPAKSTKAAIKYLKVLLGEFGDVALAMAAYNAGEGRIRAELRRIDDPINNRDFWYIYRTGTLASETNEYVPKIIATMIIDKNRARYRFPPD